MISNKNSSIYIIAHILFTKGPLEKSEEHSTKRNLPLWWCRLVNTLSYFMLMLSLTYMSHHSKIYLPGVNLTLKIELYHNAFKLIMSVFFMTI